MSFLFALTSPEAQAARWDKLSQPFFLSPLADTSALEGPISAIAEDQQGFIWLVSANGLWRWDSQNLQAASFVTQQTSPVPQVLTVTASQSGNIWVGTDQGLYQVTPGTTALEAVASGKLSHISIENINAVSLTNTPVLLLADDRALYQYNVITRHLKAFKLPGQLRIHALHVASNQQLWVGTGSGLYTALPESQGYGPLHPSANFAPVRISSIASTHNQSLVIGTAAEGLFIRKPHHDKFSRFSLHENRFPWIYAMAEIRPNVLLLGTFGKGLIEINVATGMQRHFVHNRLQPAPLADNNIWSLLSDSRGRVWIGAGQALNVYDGQNTAVKHIYGGIGSPNGLSHPKVVSVLALNDSLLVGNGPAGIQQLFPDAAESKTWWPSSRDPVETLYAGQQGDIFASSNFATVKIDPFTLQTIPVNLSGRSSDRFTDAIIETVDTLWLGGTDGLWMYSKSGNNPIQSVFKNEQGEHRVASLLLDDDTLWIGTWKGLLKAQIVPKSVTVPEVTAINHPVIRQQFISQMRKDPLGQIWIGTSRAGLFVKTKSRGWLQIKTAHGLPSNAISTIAGVSQGQLWVGTSRGIAAVDINSHKVSAIVTGTASVNSPIFRGAGTQTIQNEFVFGGINGLSIIDPAEFDFSPEALPLRMTGIDIITDDGSLVSPSVLENQSFSLAPLPKRITFEFAVLDYLDNRHVQYRYRMTTLNSDWTMLKNGHNTVAFTAPAPGDYQLEIEYTVDGRHWEAGGIQQRFNIKPAWYQTITAKLIGIFLAGVLLYLLNRLALRHYHYRQILLEQRVDERTAELLKANQKLNEQATALEKASLTDALTGLHNRRFLDQNIHRDIAKVQRYYENCRRAGTAPNHSTDILFFLIDLDHFKQVNDTFGHHAGDNVLVETQKRLKQIFRETDYLIRWGGEEFLVVVHDTPREAAAELAERVNEIIAATPFTLKASNQHPISCSIGFAAYPLSTKHFALFDWEATVAIADAALYQAKHNKRNTWVGFSKIPGETSDNELTAIMRQPGQIFAHAPVLARDPKHSLSNANQA